MDPALQTSAPKKSHCSQCRCPSRCLLSPPSDLLKLQWPANSPTQQSSWRYVSVAVDAEGLITMIACTNICTPHFCLLYVYAVSDLSHARIAATILYCYFFTKQRSSYACLPYTPNKHCQQAPTYSSHSMSSEPCFSRKFFCQILLRFGSKWDHKQSEIMAPFRKYYSSVPTFPPKSSSRPKAASNRHK